jgi:hypothetical protein
LFFWAGQTHSQRLERVSLKRFKSNGRKWEFPREKLNTDKELLVGVHSLWPVACGSGHLTVRWAQGSGAFGNVYLGLADGLLKEGEVSKVAVKMLNTNAEELDKQDFLAEIEVMQQFESHPNIVAMLGYCTSSEPMYLLVSFGAMLEEAT